MANEQIRAMLASGRFELAKSRLSAHLSVCPTDAEALSLLALALKLTGDVAGCLPVFERAAALRDDPETLSNYSNALIANRQPLLALEKASKAIQLNPALAEAHINKAIALRHLGRIDEALAACDQALHVSPQNATALFNKGTFLLETDKFREATHWLKLAISKNPNYAKAHHNLAYAYRERCDLPAAIHHFERALELDPGYTEAKWNLALSHLLNENFVDGLPLYESRWERVSGPRRVLCRLKSWTGTEDLTGKSLAISCEQGFGDSIQFCRYIPMIEELGAQVTLLVPKELCVLFRSISRALSITTDEHSVEADLHIPMMSIPLALLNRGTFSPVTAQMPYLLASNDASSDALAMLGPSRKKRIGICWRGSQLHARDRFRSIPLTELLKFVPDNVSIISLQKDPSLEELFLLEALEAKDLSSQLTDFDKTAGFIGECAELITVDTSVAHLGGALGVPVKLLIRDPPDWRWGLNRMDSLWYPMVDVIRIGRVEPTLARAQRG
jgi:tetratricopeptide (TPR) repeat protein